jgi:nitrite reductase/ring-hydroxylating ferredoxin subunit
MKKVLILLAIFPFLFGCDSGKINYNNPNIPNYPVNLSLNLSVPPNSNLQFPSNSVVNYSQGARGIVIFNAGNSYVAYDLACPNQPYSSCTSPMTITGIEAKCSCDNTVYNLFSGQSPGQPYAMKPYHVEIVGGNIIVYNN